MLENAEQHGSPSAGSDQGTTNATGDVMPLVVGASDATQPQKLDSNEDWRARLAGDDAKFLKRLDRFGSLADFAKSYRELETKLSRPRDKPTLQEGATEAQIAEFRREVGVPDDGKYNVELGGGFVWSDADKPMLDSFAEAALAGNIPQAEVTKVLSWYRDHTQAQAAAMAAADASFKQEAEEKLREEFGADFKRTINASRAAIEHIPEDLRVGILLSRLPDGTLLGNHPSMVKFLSWVTHELNPEATVIPAGPSQAASGEARMQELQALMGDKTSAYWSGPSAEALQAEYRDRIVARDRASRNA